MGQETSRLDLWWLVIYYLDGWSHVWDKFGYTFMLDYMLQKYGNRLLVPKTYIQNWEKWYGYLGGYSFRIKGSNALLRDKRLYKLGYLNQLSTRMANTPIL